MRQLALVCIAVIGLLVVPSCKGRAAKAHVVVGLVIPQQNSSDAEKVLAAARSAAEQDGRAAVELRIAERGEMARVIDDLTKDQANGARVAGIVVFAPPGLDADQVIHKHVMTGRPVVLFGCDLPDSSRSAFIPLDAAAAGTLLAKEVVDNSLLEQKIAVITAVEGPNGSAASLNALKKELSTKAGVTIVKTIRYKSDNNLAEKLAQLRADVSDLHAIVSTGPWVFHPQVSSALQGFKGRLYAVDNSDEALGALKDGRCSVLIVHDISVQARLATEACLDLLRGQIPNEPSPVKPIVLRAGGDPGRSSPSAATRPLSTTNRTD